MGETQPAAKPPATSRQHRVGVEGKSFREYLVYTTWPRFDNTVDSRPYLFIATLFREISQHDSENFPGRSGFGMGFLKTKTPFCRIWVKLYAALQWVASHQQAVSIGWVMGDTASSKANREAAGVTGGFATGKATSKSRPHLVGVMGDKTISSKATIQKPSALGGGHGRQESQQQNRPVKAAGIGWE